jgi:selenocysteine lyase/cysteine desulfurase
MVSVRVPVDDAEATQARLLKDFRIEIPVFARKTEPLLRASFAPYNDESDLDSLVTALDRVLNDS